MFIVLIEYIDNILYLYFFLFTAGNLSHSLPIPVGLNFLFLNSRNRAMLLDETLIEVFDIDIGFKRIFYLTD